MPFVDVAWAGLVGQRLWIESFAVEPEPPLGNGDIEYKGLTATGFETPWLAGGTRPFRRRYNHRKFKCLWISSRHPTVASSSRYGLIAGNGKFPFLVLEAARTQGIDMVVAAIKELGDR